MTGMSPYAVDRAATWYREHMAWPTYVANEAVLLPLGRGLVAFDVPASHAARVRDRLKHNGFSTPALLVGAQRARAMFLAEADEVVLGQFQMPDGVRFLTVQSALELPMPYARITRNSAWFCAPDRSRRWLFPASTALTAIKTAMRPTLRARPQNHRRIA